MVLRIYNTLSKEKEEFKPINPGKVGMYVCGPTVYYHCHLGHGRGYVAMDVLRRYLEYLGYEVRFIMNYTDVGHLTDNADSGEDKIEQQAKKEKVDPINIANAYIKSSQEDFAALNIKPSVFNPRPTQYIAQIIKFIEELIEKGYAYETNGSVYFAVEKFPEYGKLSGRKIEELLSGARIEINPEKRSPLDFALWIKAPKDHLLKWESPWSTGYPGWHIECSVMSSDLLGQDTFDIHGGGNENIFPHNENEIAQSEANLGKTMANYWVLWNMVNIDGAKMSKSSGNYTTIKDALKKYDPSVIRLWIISAHYRSVLDYSEVALDQAKVNFQRITDFVHNLKSAATGSSKTELPISNYIERFEEAMNDDLNTPLGLSVLYELITECNKQLAENELSSEAAKDVFKAWEKMNKVFGLIIPERFEIPKKVIALAEDRKSARNDKDFKKSDELREQIEKMGYTIEDLHDNNYLIKPIRSKA